MSYEPRPDVMYQELKELRELVRQLLTGAPLGYSSITQGSLRVASNEGLLVEGSAKVEGWLVVTGTERVTGLLEILGTLRAAGVIELTGPVTISGATTIGGDTTVTGKLDVDGNWSLDGDGDITGDVELTGSMNVEGDGHIQVGATRIGGGANGLIESLIEILISTPEFRVVGGMRVEQGAIFDGNVNMPGLIPIAISDAPPNAYLNSICRDDLGRLRLVVPG